MLLQGAKKGATALYFRPQYYQFDHAAFVRHAFDILAADGSPAAGTFLHTREGIVWREALARGAVAADTDVFAFYHFHHPFRHCGFLSVPKTSAQVTEAQYERAVKFWQWGHRRRAMYHLGIALHMLQDATVPHHAALLGSYFITDPHGHAAYELWLRDKENWREFSVGSGGLYQWTGVHSDPEYGVHETSSTRIYDWVDEASARSFEFSPLINRSENPDYKKNWPEAAVVLVPLMLRLTAGFIHLFCTKVAEESI
jgi:phospholipase C